MRRTTIYVALALVLVAAAGGVAAWRLGLVGQTDEPSLRSTTVERGRMLVAVSATGKIAPAARVGLTFETPGQVAEVFVEEGDHVETGEALARLVTDELELQVEQSRAALAAAEAQLAQLRAGPRPKEIEQAEANVRSAQAQVNTTVANRNQLTDGPTEAEIASAEAQVAQAWTDKEIAQDNYDLIEDDDSEEKEQANYDLYTAKQQLAAAEARLDDVRAGANQDERRAANANVAAAVAQRDAAQAQLDQLLAGATEEEIADAEAQVDQARVALKLAEHTLEEATLRAPFDGVVTEINLTSGEVPPTQEQPMVLIDNTKFHITVSVDELDISRLKPGQEVDITVEALPEADVTGTVDSISPVANRGTGVVSYDVVIDIDAAEAPLRSDMTANATVTVEELSNVLKIPTWVIRIDRDTGQTYVNRRSGEEMERVDVELGVRYEGTAQVISGLSEGDEVVQPEESTAFGFER